jgi:hypothetical protein
VNEHKLKSSSRAKLKNLSNARARGVRLACSFAGGILFFGLHSDSVIKEIDMENSNPHAAKLDLDPTRFVDDLYNSVSM